MPKAPVLPIKTLKLRLKDKHAKMLCAQAREVNFVWNYVNELSARHTERTGKFFSAYDLHSFTKGAGKEGLSLHSQSVQAIADEYVTRRKQFKKRKLAWRTSSGARRSLGWIPFKASAIHYRAGQLVYQGRPISLWDSYGLSHFDLGAGSFSEDARGRWYVNVTVKLPELVGPLQPAGMKPSLGIDLGLKAFAGFSDERVKNIEAQQFYRDMEPALALAQRACKPKRVKAIHAKIKNRRKDHHHKLSGELVKRYGAIFVGNVNASALVKTKLAKSVLDAGWSQFRTLLQYKCDRAAVWFDEVNEAYSTQTCGACKNRTGPKGREGLGIREWSCQCCGASHDRDRNAAKNILAAGHGRLEAGILP